MSLSFLLILTYSLLYLTVVLLWIPTLIPLWAGTFILTIIFALFSHLITPIALISISFFAIAAYVTQSTQFTFSIRCVAGLAVLLLGYGLIGHYMPGFNHLKVLDAVHFSQDAIPFTLYLNLDKTIVGIFILGFSYCLITDRIAWKTMLIQTLPHAVLLFVIIIGLSLALGFVGFEVKFPVAIFIWVLTNLLFVSMAEEAFFRGFIQKYLTQFLLNSRCGNLIAILIAALLFGCAHYAGGIKYVFLATVAGIGYGWVYWRSQRIEASILTHFSLNLLHFLFFTYPALS